MKNKRLTEKFGIHEGDRVRLSVMRDVQGPDPDWEYINEICGKQYVRQIAGIEEAPEIAEKICQYIYDLAVEFKEEKDRVQI